MADPLLSVSGIEVRYGPVRALSGVTLTIQAREVVGILGGNASGKSTTIKSVLGLVPLAAGEVRFDGRDMRGLSTEKRIGLGMASVPEGRRVFAAMSVQENLMMGAYARRRDGKALGRDLQEMLSVFPQLGPRLSQSAGTLSGGEQQMVALARALMRKPKLLCIDEPSMGLSPQYVDVVYDVLARLKSRGLTILVVEQNANRALELADRAYILRNGELVRQGRAAELRSDPEVQRAYLGG